MLGVAVLLSLTMQQTAAPGPLGERLDSVVRAAEAQGFHGVVMVTQRGEVLLHRGYGFANHATGSRFSPTTLVQIGSNVKDFTKVAIYQMVERGRLRTSDSLHRFVRDLPADKRGITIQHLLDHRAGLPLGASGGDQRALTRAELLREVRTLRLESAPGTRERYSNTGFALLALVIEELSGKPFDVYVRDEILRPTGLRETGSHLAGFDPARIAHGYGAGNNDIGVVLDMPHDSTGHFYQLRGNGGYLSTLADMRRFYGELRSGTTLLREEANRRTVFGQDGPSVMAGSDLTSFFLFGNFPGAQVEIIIASNHVEFMGNRLMPGLLPVLGIRGEGDGPGDRREMATGPAMDRLPDTGPGRTVAAWLEAYNSGDTLAMRRFFTEKMQAGPQAPPIETRVQRYRDMWAGLGRLTLRGVRDQGDGELAVTCEASNGDSVTLTFVVDTESPWRLRGIRVMAG